MVLLLLEYSLLLQTHAPYPCRGLKVDSSSCASLLLLLLLGLGRLGLGLCPYCYLL